MALPRVVWYGAHVDLSGSDSDGELGRRGQEIRGLVHHRSVGSLESLIREFTNQSASGASRRVCSHFAIGLLGDELVIAQFIALENTAYCNGQSASDRAACRWQPWIDAGRPGTNYITVSTEHEDNGAAGDYVVVEAIVAASIELDRLLLAGDGVAIRKAGIRCSDAAARQLGRLEPSSDTLIDHKVCAPVSKPFCWRPIGKDRGFPQARFIAALTEVPDMPGVAVKITAPAYGVVTVKDIAGVKAAQIADRELFGMAPGTEKTAFARGVILDESLGAVHKGKEVAIVGDEAAVLLWDQVDFEADEEDCAVPVNAALDHVEGPAKATLTAIGEARPRPA